MAANFEGTGTVYAYAAASMAWVSVNASLDHLMLLTKCCFDMHYSGDSIEILEPNPIDSSDSRRVHDIMPLAAPSNVNSAQAAEELRRGEATAQTLGTHVPNKTR